MTLIGLGKKYPSTIFLVIFQSTTGGTARGGIMPEYDAQVVIQVDDGIAKIEKNRYSEGKVMAYSVFDYYVIDDF